MEGWTGRREKVLSNTQNTTQSGVGNENGVFEKLWGGMSD